MLDLSTGQGSNMLKQAIDPVAVAQVFLQSLKSTPKNAYQYGRLSGILARRRTARPQFYTEFIDELAPRLQDYPAYTKKFNEHPLLRQNAIAGRKPIKDPT